MRGERSDSVWCAALAKGCSKVNSTRYWLWKKNILWKNPKGHGNKLDWNWLYRISTMQKEGLSKKHLGWIIFLFHGSRIQVMKGASVYSHWTFLSIYLKKKILFLDYSIWYQLYLYMPKKVFLGGYILKGVQLSI